MNKMLEGSSSFDIPEPKHVKPHALHEEDVAERKAAKVRKSKEMLGEEALKLDTTINGIDIQVRFSPAQKEYVLSFPGAKGNALEIGNSAANAREIFGRAVGLAAGQKGVAGVPNIIERLQTLALELQAEPEEGVLVEEAPAVPAAAVEAEIEAPARAPENEPTPGMKEILAEERTRKMQEGDELLNRENATERGARILQERFFAIDESLITQDVALAARERAVQSRLGKFFAGAVGLAANAWDSTKALTKGLVVEGGGAVVDVFKPTETGAMRRFMNFVFDDAMIGTAISFFTNKEGAYNQAKLEGLEERLREKTAHEEEVARVTKEKAEAIAALNTEKYGTATPGIAQRFSVWREERDQKKELARLSKAETKAAQEAAQKEAAIELAQAFAARGGDVFSQEEAETIGMKLLENEEIANGVKGMAKGIFGGPLEIVRGNLLMLRLISKIFTTERFVATNLVGSRIDKALRSSEEQTEFEASQIALKETDDERVVGWFTRNIVQGTVAGVRALGSAFSTIGSLQNGGKEIDHDAEPKETSLAERLLSNVFRLKDRHALKNAEIQVQTVESSIKAKWRMRKAYEGLMFAVNAARAGRINDEMLRNNPELVANLRKALQNLEESELEEITEGIELLDDVEQSA
ncbi:MAG: hypothetical protein AAB473_03490 [Patescibacteria group bacterium]